MNSNRIAIYPGTFDPVTFGHLDIIVRSSKIFENVVVGIAKDTKKSTHFTLEERVEMLEAEIERLKITNVKIKAFSGLLVKFVESEGSKIIIRGLRALSDFEYEFQMAYMNHKLAAGIETIFLPATENGNFISSSFVNEISRLGGNLKGFVSELVEAKMQKRCRNK